MKGIIKKIISKIVNKCRSIYINHTAKHITISVAEMFFQHNGQNDFLRYDMIVRLLAVECYYGKNEYGFDFYKRMQKGRTGKEWAEKAVGIFEELIKSFDTNGYDKNSEILLDKNLHLIDGSHRMALAMFYNIRKINAKVVDEQHDVFYSIEWFRVNGFSIEECKILKDKYKELHAKYMQPFICTLWHPVSKDFDEITEKLKLFGKVVDVKDYHLSEHEYMFYTRGIYSVDDIAKWKIEKKIGHMIDKSSTNYNMRMIALELECPDFRLKFTNNSTLSKKCELIKKVIRTYYKERVNNYFHDIITHIGDNFYQNRHIYRLFTMPSIDVKSMLDHIKDCNYVIIKSQAVYMPSDFPIHYPLGKDLDIVCADAAQYHKVKHSLMNDVEKYKPFYHIRIIEEKDKNGVEYRTLLRIQQEDCLVYLFDIQNQIGNDVASNFNMQICSNRNKIMGYYTPNPSNEVMVRIHELYNYPNKQHHKDYIKGHLPDINESMCDSMLKFDWRKLLYKLEIYRL